MAVQPKRRKVAPVKTEMTAHALHEGAMWCMSPRFPWQVRRIILACVVIFGACIGLALSAVRDTRGLHRSRLVTVLSVVTASSFLTSAVFNWIVTRRFQSQKGNAEPCGALAMVEFVVACNLIAGVSHTLVALGTLPVSTGFAGHHMETARAAEWAACVPMLMILMHVVEGTRCIPAPGLGGRGLARWFVASPDAFMWRATVRFWLSTVIGVAPSLWPMAPLAAGACLFVSMVLFCEIFIVLRRLTWAADARARQAKALEAAPLPRPSSSSPAAVSRAIATASTAALPRAVSREEERSKQCFMLCCICAVTWTALVLVHLGGLAGLYSHETQEISHALIDVLSKNAYASAVGHIYVEVLSPEVVLEKLLFLERVATEQRRRFLRYVMHEVRVPLNTIHLGVNDVHAQLVDDEMQRPRLAMLPESIVDSVDVLQLVQAAVATMTATLDDTLSFAAIEEGRMNLYVQPFDAVARFTTTMNMFKPTAIERDVELRVAVDDRSFGGPVPGRLLGDGRRLAAVVSNFVSNALKFSQRKSTITMRILNDGFFDADDDDEAMTTLLYSDAASSVNSAALALQRHNTTTTTAARRRSMLMGVKPLVLLKGGDSEVGPGTMTPGTKNNTKNKGNNNPAAAASASASSANNMTKNKANMICMLRVEVIDTGIGISEEDQAKLFEAFAQIRPGELQQGRGSGLGLAISKKMVQLHGGHVGVDSTPGEGSTFFFVVPLPLPPLDDNLNGTNYDDDADEELHSEEKLNKASEARTKKVPAAPARESGIPLRAASSPSLMVPSGAATTAAAGDIMIPTRTGQKRFLPLEQPQGNRRRRVNKRALVVDDVIVNRKLLANVISRQGFDCTVASDGLEAIATWREDLARPANERFSIICMDACMPNMDGYSACRIIRDEGYDGLLLGCTGNALQEDVIAFKAAGADSVVTKPISIQKLRDEIANVAGRLGIGPCASPHDVATYPRPTRNLDQIRRDSRASRNSHVEIATGERSLPASAEAEAEGEVKSARP